MASGDIIILPDGREITRDDFRDIWKAAVKIPSYLEDIERYYDDLLKDIEFFAEYPRDGVPFMTSVRNSRRRDWYLRNGFPSSSVSKIFNINPLDLLQLTEDEIMMIHGAGEVTRKAIRDFQEKYRDQIPERAKRRTGS